MGVLLPLLERSSAFALGCGFVSYIARHAYHRLDHDHPFNSIGSGYLAENLGDNAIMNNKKSLRTPRGQVSGLGSAKHGTEHWWQQRTTAIAIVLLSLYLITTFAQYVVFGNYTSATDWLASPFAATFVILFILAAFYHAVLGIQVVIEDYVHTESLKIVSILAVKFIAFSFAVLGTLSTVKVLFWSIAPHG